jgi:hypothetical protein
MPTEKCIVPSIEPLEAQFLVHEALLWLQRSLNVSHAGGIDCFPRHFFVAFVMAINGPQLILQSMAVSSNVADGQGVPHPWSPRG